jgi:hypothetical protein
VARLHIVKWRAVAAAVSRTNGNQGEMMAAANAAKKKKKKRSPMARAAATGVGDLIRELLVQKVPVSDIVEMARENFPQSRCTAKEVYWYKWQLIHEGTASRAKKLGVAKAKVKKRSQ